MGRPEAVPVALLVFVLIQLLFTPLMNVVSRREEAEADWSALGATHDPAAARALFRNLAITSHADPDPPTWSYVIGENHPTIMQRIAMVRAWEASHPHAKAITLPSAPATGRSSPRAAPAPARR